MPVASPGPSNVSTSVATPALLVGIPTGGLRAGDLAYAISTDQYFAFLPASVAAIGASVYYADCALSGLYPGRWVLKIAGANAYAEVPNAAALTSIQTAGLPLGVLVWIDTYRTWARLDSTANAGAVVADEVFASDSANFKWVRVETPLRSWSGQLAWQLDAAAGNNENSGAPGFPLLNVDELARRLPTLPAGVNYTFDFVGNVPASSRLNWSPRFTDAATGLGFSQRGTLLFRGTRTTTRSGTITAATQTSAVAQASATDPGVADWTADVGSLIMMTGGAQAGESAWIGANLGANVARVSSWCTVAGTQVGVVPALGTYDVQTLSQWACEGMIMVPQSACIVGFENFEFVSPNNAVLYLNMSGAQLTMVRCKWSAPASSSPPIACANAMLWRSSCLAGVGSTAGAPRSYQLGGPSVAQMTMSAGSMILNSSLEIITGARFVTQSDVLFQGSRLQVANVGTDAVFTPAASAVLGGNTAFYDWASDGANPARDAAIAVLGNGYVGIGGNVFGTSAVASTYGVRVEAGGVLQIATQALASCTLAGAAAAIRFDDPGIGAAVGTAIPPFVPGAVVPALQPLTTWANWTGAPFSGNASSYRGTRIIGTG